LLLIISFSLIAVLGLMKFYGNYYRYNVETRRSKLAMSVISGYLILVFLFRVKEYPVYFSTLIVPMSIYLSNYFQGDKLKFWKNLTAFVLIAYWVWNLTKQLI
jgi:multisubunit Na+/H+ antiporter MnhG subunit